MVKFSTRSPGNEFWAAILRLGYEICRKTWRQCTRINLCWLLLVTIIISESGSLSGGRRQRWRYSLSVTYHSFGYQDNLFQQVDLLWDEFSWRGYLSCNVVLNEFSNPNRETICLDNILQKRENATPMDFFSHCSIFHLSLTLPKISLLIEILSSGD